MKRYLAIIEVSKKQAYIFGKKELKENIRRSEEIRFVTDEYLNMIEGTSFNIEKNVVYSGGGHVVLTFNSLEEGRDFLMKYSKKAYIDFPEMEIYMKLNEYDDSMSIGDMLKDLVKGLEVKKALRENSFKKGTFGFEEIDPVDFRIKKYEKQRDFKIIDRFDYKKADWAFQVDDIKIRALKEDDITHGDNFISIVHIDGNRMGDRVNAMHEEIKKEKLPFEEAIKKLKVFSEQIDNDFKDGLKAVIDFVDENYRTNEGLPIRPLIYSGDDICFITAGQIGIKCAEIFMNTISNLKGRIYSSCAGVAIVHKKYPFFRAYELSEELCSNAKKVGRSLDPECNLSLIDWHIEFGQVKNSLDEIRETYINKDGKSLVLRPYVLSSDNEKIPEEIKLSSFYEQVKRIKSKEDEENSARGKYKELRNKLKQSEAYARVYIKENNMNNLDKEDLFNENSCLIFDAIESMDQVIINKEVENA